jgi:hypothetical protein
MSTSLISDLAFLTEQIAIYFGIVMFIFGMLGGFLTIIVFVSLKTFRESSCAFYLFLTLSQRCPYIRGGSRKLVRGWRLRSKNGFQSVFEAPELLFFRFYREKIEKKFYEGVAVAGSPTAGSATEYGNR